MTKGQIFVAGCILAMVALTTLLAGCGAFTTLQIVVDAAEAAVPILEASDVPIPPQVITYVSDVAQCIAGQTGNPTPTQILAMTTCMAGLVAPTLTGLPAAVVAAVEAVAQAVEKYLAQQPTIPAKIHINPTQALKISQMKVKAQDVVRRCHALSHRRQ